MLGATPYKAVDGLDFKDVKSSVEIEQHDVSYELHLQGSGYTADWLSRNLTTTSEKLVEYAESKNYRTLECRPVGKLDIYVISFDVLNNRDRFNDYADAESGMPIWALFDSRKEDPQAAAIMLTDHGAEHNFRLLAHEVAHYWAYRFCWDFHHSDIDGEDLAMDFEKYAEENR
jgi:hypothetical protein